MKTITVWIEGRIRSVAVPAESAAFLLIKDLKGGKCELLIRMKQQRDHSALTALNKAKEETKTDAWLPVSASGWLETWGGIPDNLYPYFKITYVREEGEWKLLVTEAWSEFSTGQRDLAAPGARLPEEARITPTDLQKVINMFSGAKLAK